MDRQKDDGVGGRGVRRRGRPRRRWRDCIDDDLREKHLSNEDALDRREWRRLIRNHDPI